jgi:hypothetical protein
MYCICDFVVLRTEYKLKLGVVMNPGKYLFLAGRKKSSKISIYYFFVVLLLPKIRQYNFWWALVFGGQKKVTKNKCSLVLVAFF